MSQRRSGGLESAAGRRALSQRWALSQRRAGGGYLPRSAGMRARGDKTQEQNKNKKKRTKQNEVKGRRLRLGLVFCHYTHSREDTGTRR